jgi:hypothetical protein
MFLQPFAAAVVLKYVQGVPMRTRSIQKTAFLILALNLSIAAQTNGVRSVGFSTTIHGVPPSVTSFGFGGQPGFHGVPASVTSLGFGSPRGFGNSPGRIHQQPFFASQHRHNRGFVSPFYGNIVAVPYTYPDYAMEPGVDDSMEEEDYRGGPTIFDRRGNGGYVPPEPRYRDRDEADYRRAPAAPEPAPQPDIADRPRTVLVFKDGHRLELLNYAIVGSTLYDLSGGLTRRVALAELDLPATVKQNEERGVDFQLPAGAKLN